MFKLLKRWLGWDAESSLLDLADLGARARNAAPPATKPAVAAQERSADQAPAAARRPKKEREPLDVLDNPALTLDKPSTDDGFDPYNTGAFNRSASWERIGRNRKR
jgi:hypothetical protein